MKKKLILLMCVCAVMTYVCGCSKSEDTKSDSKAADSSEGKEETAEGADKRIETLEKNLDNLAEVLATLTETSKEDILNGDFDFDDFNFDEDIHPIYDDTAVVEAYKSGDKSKLTDEKDIYILDSVSKAIDEIIEDGMTDYEKEFAVYNYIFNGTRYDDSALAPIDSSGEFSHTPYGFFHDHNTICVGNATTFKLFMDILGIDCQIIHSTENGEHAWDIVKLDDEWYHVDVTFDGGDTKPLYSFFNVTDDAKDDGSYPWDHDEFPACEGTKYNYALQNAEECDSIYKIPELLKKASEDKDSSAVYLKLPVPDGADADAYCKQLEAIMNSLECESGYVSATVPIVCDDGKSVVVGGAIVNSYDVPDMPDDKDLEELNPGNVDYNKLRESFDEQFGGEVSLSEDIEDQIYYYMYKDYYNSDVWEGSKVTEVESINGESEGQK